MIEIILDFIGKCNANNITPDEKHIDAYLNVINRLDLRDNLIKFCFYNWEERNNTNFINRLIDVKFH